MSTAIAAHARPLALERLGRWVPPAAAVLAGGGPVLLLGFNNGGYPVEVIAAYGVVLWWLLLVGLTTGAIPRPRPTVAGWLAIGALVGLTAWGAISLNWSANPERGLTEVVRAIVAGGSVLLGMSAVRAGQGRALAGGVLAGLSIIVAAGVLSRLQPGLFPSATETGTLLPAVRTRLAWPLNYWNAIAAAGAVAIPLGLALATRARHAWSAGLAVAPVPVLALGIAYALSRGGIVALALGLAAALLVVAPRPVLVRTMLAPAVGTGALLLGGLRPSALTDVAGGAAQSDAGARVLVLAILVTAGVGIVQAGWTTADQGRWTPRIPRPSRRMSVAATGLAVAILLAGGLAAGGSQRLSDAWRDFQVPTVAETVPEADTAARLGSLSSSGRYQVWERAREVFADHPLGGTGLGSWEAQWNLRDRGSTGFVRNAHSELFELLAETGIVGALLFVLAVGAPVVAGAASAARRRTRIPDAALVVPALVAFVVALAIDWNWQIGAFAVAGTTLGAVALSRARDDDPPPTASPQRRRTGTAVARVGGIAVVAVGAIVALSLALVAPNAVNGSREAAARGDLSTAADRAAEGAAAAPFAASPALQQALIEEQAGRLPAAAAAAAEATHRTPEDWRAWFVVARIAAARGQDERAVAAFRRARSLNPDSAVLGR